ncbi:MAG: IS200/IS605 family accessory protein TnpB-related protein [Ignisphaera sp.]
MGLRSQARDRVAEIASRYGAVVVLEDLNHLRDRVNGGSSLNKKLYLWFYRRIQFTVSYETLERGFVARYVNPGKTSSTCPRYGSRLKDNGGGVLKCTMCGSQVIEMWLRASTCSTSTQDVECPGSP